MILSRTSVTCLIASILLATSVRGQLVEDYRFQGQVLDTNGRPLAGVEIVLRNAATGERIVFETRPDGGFDRRMIPHAVYEATFSKTGYAARTERFDWSASGEETLLRQVRVVLESDADLARRDIGAKAGKLYEGAYASLAAGDCVTASQKASELLGLGAGTYEYAVRFVLARCKAMQDSVPAAVAEYRRVLASKPDLFEAHFDLAGLLERQGDHSGAVDEYAQAARLHPEDPDVEYNAGVILFQQKDFAGARTHLERAIALAPDRSQAYKALGFAALQAEKKDLPAAAKYLSRYLELTPDAADAAQIREILQALPASPPPGK